MCGICGAVGFDDPLALVQRMNRAMVHRGPDSEGFLHDGDLALGMRRLRIIDLDTGDQPIYNEDHSVAIVFNGEIYNFQALCRELEGLSHIFVTRSDTEAIVHAYEQWGVGCLERLRGMFAFALWDRRPVGDEGGQARTGRLLLARDRLGIKPLYVWQDGGQLLFASEVRALLADGVPRQLSPAGLYTYLLLGSVQEPLTMVEGVTSLPPASWLQLDLIGDVWQARQGVYWRPPRDGDPDPAPEEVRAWLADAVRCRLVSDVPLGSFLSGGLDSGAVVALGSQAQDRPLRTFTLAFDDWPDDEREYAGQTARQWRTEHQTRVVSPAGVLADLPEAISAMDQPTTDGINTWYVSREARRAGLTVALSGVGGDELFAGYPSFRRVPRLKQVGRIARLLPAALTTEERLAWLPGQPDAHRKLSAFLQGRTPFGHPYFAVRGLFSPGLVARLMRPDVADLTGLDAVGLAAWEDAVGAQVLAASHYDAVGEVSWLEISQYMRSTLLRDTDAMSMAHSLEVRVPLVDHLLVERVLPIRAGRKLDGRRPKPLLVGALGGMLPEEVAAGAKRTFTFPFQLWLRQELAEPVGRCLQSPSDVLACWLDPAAVRGVWRDFGAGRTNWARPWALYVLDAWVSRNL